jgi:hypothetical protein
MFSPFVVMKLKCNVLYNRDGSYCELSSLLSAKIALNVGNVFHGGGCCIADDVELFVRTLKLRNINMRYSPHT